MLASVRYEYERGNVVWPVPFPFGGGQDIGVNLVDGRGHERPLTEGSDYVLQDASIICVLPQGCSLIIYMRAAQDAALAANAARVLTACEPQAPSAQAAQAQPAQAQAAQPASSEPELARLAEQLEELSQKLLESERREREAQAQAQAQALAEADAARLAELEHVGVACARALDDKTDLALESIEIAAGEIEDKLDARAKDLAAAASLAEHASGKAEALAADAHQKVEEAIARLTNRIALIEEELNSRAELAAKALERAVQSGALNISREAKAASLAAEAASQKAVEAAEAAGAKAARAAALASREASLAASQAASKAQAEIESAARLAGQAWPQSGWRMLSENLLPNSVISLPEPLRYWPGRNSLFITRNGFALVAGRDYAETGQPTALSNSIRLTAPAARGDVLGFWLMPINSAQAASEEARHHAAMAEREAQAARAQAREAQAQRKSADSHAGRSRYYSERAEAAAATVDGWHPLCQAEAKSAWQANEQARLHAYTASICHMRPGLSHVRNVNEALRMPEGCFIVNPRLPHAPNPFYGIFPVADADEIKWDGFFFFGPAYTQPPYVYPPPPEPGPCPCLPDGTPPSVSPGGMWQPCNHKHSACAACARQKHPHERGDMQGA